MAGWIADLIDYYLHYCETIFNRYKGKVHYWLTFNEINCRNAIPLASTPGWAS